MKNDDVVFELHVSSKTGTKQHIESTLPQNVPLGVKVQVFRWEDHNPPTADSERLHNRYFLTDLGGLSFGIGLDQANPGNTVGTENDDINLLTKEQHLKHLSEYCNGSSCFQSLGDPFEITGMAAL